MPADNEFTWTPAHELRELVASKQVSPVELAEHALERAGIQLIVEKIEKEEQLVDLLDYGINYGQGYLFGTPRLSRDI